MECMAGRSVVLVGALVKVVVLGNGVLEWSGSGRSVVLVDVLVEVVVLGNGVLEWSGSGRSAHVTLLMCCILFGPKHVDAV